MLFPKPHTNAWGSYLENHAIKGKLRIARFDKSMGLVQRKHAQSKPEEVLKLGEEFCFQLDSNIKGYAVAFQEHQGTMHPLPLGFDGQLTTSIEAGEQFLPLDDIGHPEKLSEASDLGHHRFVIAVAKDAKILPSPKQPPQAIKDVAVHHLSVQISI